jgi:hypothetical protein
MKNPGEKEFVSVIYKEDMLIMVNNSGVSACDKFYIVVSVLMMLTVYAGIPLGIIIGPQLFGLCGAYLVYLIWSCCHHSTRYVCNLKTLKETFKNIERAIKAPPIVTFHIQNYHYETRTYTERDADGNTQTRTETVRVNTHAATEHFHFDRWQDRSPPASTLHFLSVLLLARLRTYKFISYSPKAAYSFQG